MNIQELKLRLQELEAEMSTPAAASDPAKMQALNKEYKEKKDIVETSETVSQLLFEIEHLELSLNNEPDPEMAALTREEIIQLGSQLTEAKNKLEDLTNPADPLDKKDIIIEIRPGAGGDESALFAAELFRMYTRYAERHGWRPHIISANRTELGGYKEIIFEVHGDHVYRDLKYESGVHRVQRVPATEKAGRVHTSTVTVAVLPEAEEADIQLKPEDLRIDTFMAGGHGGQSVNTTYSAVRVVHVPTGMIVTCQDEKSQQQNRLKALQVLASRLLALEKERLHQERADARKSQIGTGDRSEKIRTYNFPQDRLTDHRIKYTGHSLPDIMDGDLDELIQALHTAEKQTATT
ncbi:MAG: peptide chain release factor 1 [Candidatus Komeilibacteria bacterium]